MLEKTYLDIIKKNRLSNTSSRRAVFKSLADAHRPLRIKELLALCPTVDRVTVYRIIEVFEKIGVVHRVQIGWKYAIELSDVFQSHHHHAVCEICGHVITLNKPETLEKELEKLAINNKFKITHHTIELQGVCNNCSLIAK